MENFESVKGITKESLEIIANDIGIRGIGYRRKGDIINARKHYAVSFGLNSYLERYEFMCLFDELLRTTNLSNEKLEEYRKFGRDVVVWALGLPSCVRKTLDEK